MNNNSHVTIPVRKLVEMSERCCPPGTFADHCAHLAYEDCDGRTCIECWEGWLKDGE